MKVGGLLAVLALSSVAAVAAETKHWSYSGNNGPPHWGELEPDYATCAKGKAQSPVDIETANVGQHALPPLQFSYKPAALHIINNGHTIQINVPSGSELVVGGEHYALAQFHFHQPSEEKINGKSFAMVAHLVHRDAQGHLAVVAVLLQPGQPNPLLSTLWRNLPPSAGHEQVTPHVAINTAELLPQSRGYYTYSGSLTTPPCSEGVRWFVLKAPMTLSTKQLATFSKLYRGNARSIQRLNGRVVLSSK